jgi:site-specific DNA recombinase
MERWSTEVNKLMVAGAEQINLSGLADLQERIRAAEERSAAVQAELQAIESKHIDESEVVRTLAAFDPVWDTLTPGEQARILQLLVEHVDYDGAQQRLSITFRPSGIQTLATELANHRKEKSA